ncbi:MAG TPA: DUF1844 domain-containing protein [Phycisphaerae bacterium]|jgi:hypothetical protein
MSEQPEPGKIHVDSDWKLEAQREKERLAELEKELDERGPLPDPSFAELLNMLAMQAAIGLGGFQTPQGQRLPPDLEVAKHHIDMIELLEKKTAGNLTEQEKGILDRVLYELRMQYVQAASGGQPRGR